MQKKENNNQTILYYKICQKYYTLDFFKRAKAKLKQTLPINL